MRKSDYAHLAEILRSELRIHRSRADGAVTVDSLEHVAREFAKHASVDRVAFLTACGITP